MFDPGRVQDSLNATIAGRTRTKFVDHEVGYDRSSLSNHSLEDSEPIQAGEMTHWTRVEDEKIFSEHGHYDTNFQIALSGRRGGDGSSSSAQVSNSKSMARAADTVSVRYSRNTDSSYLRGSDGAASSS